MRWMVALLMVRLARSTTIPLVFGVPGLVRRCSVSSPQAWPKRPSLSAVNVARAVIRQEYPSFSIANIKSLLYNFYVTKRFFAVSGFRPNKSLNAKNFKELSDIAARAA